ncbi:MAG: hypothetical protein U1C72_02595, partial [Candidatus Pacearchaeota archaeon]|nr:hypothetical protein [Candidatus Pacearchaeota archaeon]
MSRKRNLVPLLVLGIFGVLVVVAIVISRPADNKIPPKAEGWDPGQRADELNEPKTPSVSLSSLTPEQSETLVVVSDQEPVTGWFNG